MNITNTTISKFLIENNVYYIRVIWKEDDNDLFLMKLYDGDSTWSGRFPNSNAEKFRTWANKNEQEYNEEIRKCLSEQNKDYVYTFCRNEMCSATLSWSKSFDDALVRYGSITVRRDDEPELKDTILDLLLLENKSLKQTFELANKKIEDLEADLARHKLELEKYVNIKTSIEASLYAKFSQLLNAKKRRIQLLEEELRNIS